jgi:hypothetical protein
MVVPPPTSGDKRPECEDVCVQKPSIAIGEIIVREGGMIDVALASRCKGAIDCLQDVRFAILAVLRLFALLLNFHFSLLF